MIFCRDCWPWTKPGYITMTRRQSNNQWSGGIAAHSAQKNSECKNPLDKFSPRFFGIKTASSSLIIFLRAKLSTRSITHLFWCNWRAFWRKNAAECSLRGSLLGVRSMQWNIALCNRKSTNYPWLHNEEKLRTSTLPQSTTQMTAKFRLLYRHVLEYSTV